MKRLLLAAVLLGILAFAVCLAPSKAGITPAVASTVCDDDVIQTCKSQAQQAYDTCMGLLGVGQICNEQSRIARDNCAAHFHCTVPMLPVGDGY